MKRNSALIRKLRTLSEEARAALLDDIAKTNQSKVGTRHLLGQCKHWSSAWLRRARRSSADCR